MPDDSLTEDQARAALLSLANGGLIGRIAKDLGMHHQTLKRLLIEFDAAAFKEVYSAKKEPKRRKPPRPPAAQPNEDPEIAAIRRELKYGRSLREVAKARNKSMKAIAAMLPDDLLQEAAPRFHEKKEASARLDQNQEVLRLLQMDCEPEEILHLVEGSQEEQVQALARLCKEDTLGSRWAFKQFGPFFCYSGRSRRDRFKNGTGFVAILVRCRCGHEQWRSTIGLCMGVARCEKCGATR